jgi:acyl-CoA synthetase (AMP-forming)/AMP-acid ligase II
MSHEPQNQSPYWTDIPTHLRCDVLEAETLCEVIEHRARNQQDTHFCTVIERRGEQTLSFGQLYAGACQVAATLRGMGLKPDDRVALMLPTGVDFLLSFFGTQMAGLVPAAIAPPFMPRQMDFYIKGKCDLLHGIGAVALIVTPDRLKTAAAIQAGVPGLRHVITPEQFKESAEDPGPLTPIGPHQIAMIQFSSGSNGRQKGVGLTHANLVNNIRAVHFAMSTTPEDVVVTWLPLYHDMGLLGCVCQAIFAGCGLALMSPTLFIASPLTWFKVMHEKNGTIGVAPNFGYQLCVDRIADLAPEQIDLSRWRMALNGSEMVSVETIDRFTERFGPLGFRRQTFMPVYGLAEATVAVCFTPPNSGAVVDCIDRQRLERDGVAEACATGPQSTSFVSVGKPIPGVQVRLVDRDGHEVGERVQGRILVRAPSVMDGYFNDPIVSSDVLRGGWLDTGDLGYRVAENIFITGRAKDVIIKAGRNYVPEHFEQLAAAVPGVRKNAVAAFGVDAADKGTEDIVVMAETKIRDPLKQHDLVRAVKRSISARLELMPDDVCLVPPRTIPKTTSGKVQRPLCRQLYVQYQCNLDRDVPESR